MHTSPITRARKGTPRPVRVAACVALLVLSPLLPAQVEKPGIAFSAAEPGAPLPAGWKNLPVVKGKAMTQYTLVRDGQTTVLQADAEHSASALMHEGNIDLARTPVVAWRWKAAAPIKGADNSVAAKEDAPARLVFLFDGDKSKLSLRDRAGMGLAKIAGGEDIPYATLMYIWSTTAPPGSVIPNPRTGRVQMIVVSGQPGDSGEWQSLRRNIAQDYEMVFHEKPGRITAWGLLTDTDNTGSVARAWYGDIQFLGGP
ncbi:DUF3047 domain-containing protein [Ramlibacter ginsenosidimutans]|uniref:DUF3047 domain-containing protein n=1 Tax=Ramlibacter ginsenosidimutans TaxID=502333 RepID=A0A934WJK8_9BURK|nr:DUF3047 domain-containing protein [Ramlibacter ginsenosidimutans]MBK6004759.1 DUF3047 domain-containing protein [Ramlibacter ginsenosidimutans]